MASEFWFKFNFKDWKYDTQLLSTEEKGLLIELIIFMRENNGECEINFRLINRLTEIATENFQVACRTFRKQGIFDFEIIDGKEYFISRKIKKELEKSAINKENGKKGGNPALLKTEKRLTETLKRKDNRISNSNSNSNFIEKGKRGVGKKGKTKTAVREFVKLSEDEIETLKIKFGTGYEWALDKLNNYKGSKGVKYKSDFHALCGWVFKQFEKDLAENGPKKNSLQAIHQTGEEAKLILKRLNEQGNGK